MKLVMLVVEEKTIADTLCFLLKDEFLPVVTTAKTVEEEILKNKPDIVIMDIFFRDVSSYDVIEKIIKSLHDVPVIVLVDSFRPSCRRLMEIGVYEIIEKPFDPDKLRYAMKRAVSCIEAKRKEKTETTCSGKEIVFPKSSEDLFFQRLSEVITDNFKDPDRFISSITSLLRIYFSFSGVSFFVKKENAFVFHSGSGIEKDFFRKISFTKDSVLFHKIMSERRIIQKTLSSDSDIVSEMNFLKAEMVFPVLNRDGQIYGFFAIGSQITGESFPPENIRFLSVVMTYLSILIEDAFLFQNSLVQKEFQKIILENVPTGIIVLDKNCNVVIFNRHAETILEKKGDEIVGFPVEKCGVEFASRIRQIIVEKQPVFREELFIKNLNKWLGMSCDFISQNNGLFWGIVIFQDITMAKEMENERKKIEKNQYWQQIARQLSHEIKNPLVAIKTFACLLPEKFSDESFRTQFYGIVNDEIHRLTSLVEKIARLADKENLILGNVNCGEIIKKIHNRFPSVEIVSYDGINFLTKADPNKLQEALEFLLDFCVKDIEEKGKVKVALSKDAESIEILIEQTGGRVNVETTDEIFNPFSEHLNTLISLNLAICRKIIEEHSGSLRAEILPAGRKRFIIMLPKK